MSLVVFEAILKTIVLEIFASHCRANWDMWITLIAHYISRYKVFKETWICTEKCRLESHMGEKEK